MPKDLLTKQEAADELGVAVRTIESYITQGLLRPVQRPIRGRKLGTFFTRAEISRYQRALDRKAS